MDKENSSTTSKRSRDDRDHHKHRSCDADEKLSSRDSSDHRHHHQRSIVGRRFQARALSRSTVSSRRRPRPQVSPRRRSRAVVRGGGRGEAEEKEREERSEDRVDKRARVSDEGKRERRRFGDWAVKVEDVEKEDERNGNGIPSAGMKFEDHRMKVEDGGDGAEFRRNKANGSGSAANTTPFLKVSTMATNEILFFELNNGAKMPSLGLGTWQSSPGLVAEAVTTAIKIGYRHIDCAQAYDNEEEIGSALKKLFQEGVVKREELWITSKLWCKDHEPEDVPKALDRTLKNLQLDHLDLYLIHWPVKMKKDSVGFKPENLDQLDIAGTWRAMEGLFDSGKARAIGVSNFSTKKLSDLLELARVPPAVVQVECHPSWNQDKLRKFCQSKGVHLSGYSPLGSPGTTWIKSDVLQNPILKMVAEKLGKTPAQVAIRWGLQMGHSVLPKSTNKARIEENFGVFGWAIPDDLFAKFRDIEQARLLRGTSFTHETYGPYRTIEDLWDGEL